MSEVYKLPNKCGSLCRFPAPDDLSEAWIVNSMDVS